MRRFTDNIDQQCAVILISSDVNFSLDLSDFKNRKKIHVILLHNVLVSETLLLCSNENYVFDDLFDEIECSSNLPKVKVIEYY
jgi:meiosis arrest female protein 1